VTKKRCSRKRLSGRMTKQRYACRTPRGSKQCSVASRRQRSAGEAEGRTIGQHEEAALVALKLPRFGTFFIGRDEGTPPGIDHVASEFRTVSGRWRLTRLVIKEIHRQLHAFVMSKMLPTLTEKEEYLERAPGQS
jgi:hypothetical protein